MLGAERQETENKGPFVDLTTIQQIKWWRLVRRQQKSPEGDVTLGEKGRKCGRVASPRGNICPMGLICGQVTFVTPLGRRKCPGLSKGGILLEGMETKKRGGRRVVGTWK